MSRHVAPAQLRADTAQYGRFEFFSDRLKVVADNVPMPFTVAHAAAALPFRRLHPVFSALVVGTLAPDFEYFLRLAPDDGFGHTLVGVFALTLPLALLILWMFHRFVKLPLTMLLPAGFRRRVEPDLCEVRFRGATRFALIIGAVLLGIATHLVWDSFTHPTSWFSATGQFSATQSVCLS